MNETMLKFGYPNTSIGETEFWAILLRPAQVTIGSLVVAAKSDALAFGALPPGYHSDLAVVARRVEAMIEEAVGYQRINWLMLMMVDPHVHFHVLPRYEGERSHNGVTLADTGWPGTPNLKSAFTLTGAQRADFTNWLTNLWIATA